MNRIKKIKKTLLLIGLLTILFHVNSQNTEVEIYNLKSNSIIKGVVVEGSTDSLRILVDSLQTMAFAKTDLEGNEFAVSKEIKKFRRMLIRSELVSIPKLFPGIYHIRNGEVTKGRIMLVLAGLGLVVGVVGLGVFAVGISTISGAFDVLVVYVKSMLILETSLILYGSAKIWGSIDNLSRIKKEVNSRYYFRAIQN